MSVYIDLASRLNHDQAENLAVTCPHCQVVAHITPVAVPRFEDLAVHKPRQVGVVYLCDEIRHGQLQRLGPEAAGLVPRGEAMAAAQEL